MHQFIFVFLAMAHADSLRDQCRTDFRETTLQSIMKKKNLSHAEAEIVIAANEHNPSARYQMAMGEEICIAKKVESDIWAGQTLDQYCPHQKSNYGIRCMNEWLSQNRVNYSALTAVLSASVMKIGLRDKQKFPSQEKVILAHILDGFLLTLERYSTQGNVVFNPEDTSQEQALLQKVEADSRKDGKTKMLQIVSDKLSELKNGRMPTGADGVWLQSALPKLEARLSALKLKP